MAPAGPGNQPPPVALSQVLWDELRLLKHETHDGSSPAPALAEIYRRLGGAGRRPLAALCLSGGGIRSATFNLGVLQALSRRGLLGEFDYLSSVSGGGYVAGWLRAWAHRRGSMASVAAALAPPVAGDAVDPLKPEPTPLDHLRSYSNYLTPRLGAFSGDTWALAATLVRNLVLNWLVLIPALAAVVAIPQVGLMVAAGSPEPWAPFMQTASNIALAVAVAAASWSAVAVHYVRRQRVKPASEFRILGLGLLPLWISCLLLSTAALWRGYIESGPLAAFSVFWCIGIPLVGWTVARVALRAQPHAQSDRSELVGIVGSGALTAVPFFAIGRDWLPWLVTMPPLMVILAVPVLLALYLLARTLFVAFSSMGERDTKVAPDAFAPSVWATADREWWARFSGWVLLAAIGWIGVASLIVLGGYALGKVAVEGHAALAAVGGLSGLVAARLGMSSATSSGVRTDGPAPARAQELAMKLVAPFTVALLVIGLAEFTRWMALYMTSDAALLTVKWLYSREPLGTFRALMSAVGRFALVPTVLLLSSWALGWLVNVNRFSAHGLYRERLMRAYLGASNTTRRADPFTGFDPADNIQMHALAQDGAERPILVVNTTLNLARSAEHLAWQQRKAESFSVTPLYCGNYHEGYRPSRDYGGVNGISLATAITISGAAASPNSGYHSSPLATFLMTLFNARLGCWLGNTNAHGAGTYRLSGPRHAGKLLFAELFGLTDAEHPYVNLSDGGHFDNLGIYGMVLRRCRMVVASDAGQDPKHDFEDLGNVVRKVRIDFGVPIEFEHSIRVLPRGDSSTQGMACAVGRIRYDVIDPGASPGWLLYLKPTLLAPQGPPYDVVSWSRSSQLFPHEPTTDQWFSEAQFESYRALGENLAAQLAPGHVIESLADLIRAVHQDLGHTPAP